MSNTYVYAANDGVNGLELWATDIDTGATWLVMDINPGSGGSQTSNFMSLGNGLTVFTADQAATGVELWVTDGTAANTRMLRDINPGESGGGAASMVALGDGRALFSARTTSAGYELWTTDGTEAGTQLVKEINAGSGSSNPAGFTSIGGGKFVFAALDATNGRELWVTDGTSAGTTLLKNISAGTGSSSPAQFVSLGNGKALFQALDPTNGVELWVTDGTSGGTTLVKDIYSGTGSSNPNYLKALGDGTALFSANNSTNGTELWISDGTPAGTVMLKDINPGLNGSAPFGFAPLGNGKFLFRATDGVTGHEVWVTDGTAAGTTFVKDVNVGSDGSSPSVFIPIGNGKALFDGYDPATGRELWITDGTEAGTALVKDVWPGVGTPGLASFVPTGDGRMIFQANDAVSGAEPWITDGTTAGTMRLADVNQTTAASNPSTLVKLAEGKFVFTASDGFTGSELWFSDGTSAGTTLLKDIYPGSTSSTISGITPLGNGKAVFSAFDGGGDRELWVTDGTAEGTTRVKDINAGANGSSAFEFISLGGGRAVFGANDGINGPELWITDGTEAGTTLVKDIRAGVDGSSPASFASLGDGRAVFTADSAATGFELWVTDGTGANTTLVKDIFSGSSSSSPANLVSLGNGKVVFRATDSANGTELWVTDGTPGGTQMIKDIRAGSTSSTPSRFTALGDGRALFMGSDANGAELWVTDGTSAGTFMVKDINPGASSSGPGNFALLGTGRAVFSATHPTLGAELYVTDGTSAGTVLVKDIKEGDEPSYPTSFMALGNGKVVFQARDDANGAELWVTDGTAEGTTLLKDIYPGTTFSLPTSFSALGDGRATFSANSLLYGQELWVTDGTAEGTMLLKDVNAITHGSSAAGFSKVTPPVTDQPGVLTLSGLTNGAASEGTAIVASATDPDGVSGAVTYTFTDVTVPGAPVVLQTGAQASYTPGYYDAGKVISVTAAYTDALGNASSLTQSAGTVADVDRAGTLVFAGVFDGAPYEGAMFTATVTDPDGVAGPVTYTFSDVTDPANPVELQSGESSEFTPGYDSAGKVIKVTAAYIDDQGHNSVWSSVLNPVVNVDIAEPTTSILTGPGTFSNSTSASFTFSGTDDVGVTGYEVSVDGGPFDTARSPFTLDDLAEGSHTIAVRAYDASGNVDATPATYAWTVDLTPPAVAITSAGGLVNQAVQTLMGTGEAGATVILRNSGGAAIGAPVVVGDDGQWSATATLSEGQQTVVAWISDAAGNQTAASTSYDLDTTPPAAPTVALANDTGASGSDRITSDANLIVTPSAPGDTVFYRVDGGRYSTTMPTITGEGRHDVYVYARDAAGNVGPTNGRFTFTLDTVTPDVAITNAGGPVNSRTQVITGTGEAGSTVTLYDGNATLGAVTVGANGTWSRSVTLGAAQGAHQITAKALDKAGNAATSAVVTFTLDTVKPNAPTVALANDSGVSGDLVTNDVTLSITGAGEAGSVLLYRVDNGGYMTLAGNTPIVTGEGRHNILVYERDAAGNLSAASRRLTFTLDTIAPVTTIANAGAVTRSPVQMITGTGEAGTTVTILDGSIAIGSAVVAANGTWSQTVTLVGERTHQLTATAADKAGNRASSEPVTFTLDTTTPNAPTVALANDTGVAGDLITRDATLNVTTSETGSTILYRFDNGAYTTTAPAGMTDGRHNVLVYERDAAGNMSASSQRLTFTLDAVAPDVAITSSGGSVTSASQTIAGTGEAGTTVTVFDGDTALGTTTVASNGTWSRAVTLAGDGSHVITAQNVDKAGNTGTSSGVTYDLSTQTSLNRMVQAMAVAPSSASSSSPSAPAQDEPRTLVAAAH